jgi:predicted TIM-barrel fold metal-dependent hydrolase
MEKRFDGREEPAIDPGLPIIDAHHHLFDRPSARYLLEDYLADAGLGHNIVASVYVETLAMARPDGPQELRPIGEVEFANGAAAMSASGNYGPCRVAATIVGYADLRAGDRVAKLLDRALAAAPDRFRGIRQLTMEFPGEAPWRFVTNPPPSGILASPGFRPAFRHLAARGLSFDAAVFHHQLPELADLAGAFPDTTIVLNHMGQAMALDMSGQDRAEVVADWSKGLNELARRPNVVCKVGGLGLPFWGFGFERRADPVTYLELAAMWRPYVETAIEAFGVDRCMMESNFPVDGRSCGFVPLWNALKHIVNGASAAEKTALFHKTAARIYHIDPAALPSCPPSQPARTPPPGTA